jgi:hypothetical protein
VRVQARTSLTLLRVSVMLLGTVGVAGRVCAQSEVQRKIVALAATRSGSELFAAVNDESDNSASHLYAMSPASGEVIWQTGKLPEIGSAKVAPDGATVAVGLVGVPDRDAGVVLFETKSGKQSGSLGFDKKLIFAPGMVYPRFGSGVSQLNYSPNAALLYGLSNDTLFAWDVASNAYLWIRDVPAVIEAPAELPDPLPYGPATGFVLSPDGRQIAAVRDALWVATAARTTPRHFIKRSATGSMQIAAAAFSSDNRTLAAGEFGSNDESKTRVYQTELWVGGSLHSMKIEGCGGGIAWTSDPSVFGCQHGTGAHLRNVNDAQKDIGAAGPVRTCPS